MDWHEAFLYVLAMVVALFGWQGNDAMNRLKDVEDSQADCELNLQKHKVEALNQFSKKEDVLSIRVELNDTLKRIHDRMDKIYEIVKKD